MYQIDLSKEITIKYQMQYGEAYVLVNNFFLIKARDFARYAFTAAENKSYTLNLTEISSTKRAN